MIFSSGYHCLIGMNSTILKGTELGEGCIVAAGSLVNGKYPHTLMGGVPAKVIRTEVYYK